MENKIKVLFLCTANSARSQMAEAFLRAYGGDRFEVHSAGLEPKEVNPYTLKVMNEIGYDLAGHYSKGIEAYLHKKYFNYVITVCDSADRNCPTVWPGIIHRLHWSFEDPAAEEEDGSKKLEKFRLVRDLIELKIKDWVTTVQEV